MVYGSFMPNLIAGIENLYKNGKFSEMPRGPLGRYIQVVDEKWKSYIENVIGRTMHAFCVNNTNDRKVLYNYMQRECPQATKFPIITTKFINKVITI